MWISLFILIYSGSILRQEAQAGIKIAGRNINNLRYADDTTLMAGNKELYTENYKALMVRNQQLELDMEQQTGSK